MIYIYISFYFYICNNIFGSSRIMGYTGSACCAASFQTIAMARSSGLWTTRVLGILRPARISEITLWLPPASAP
ncbi:hypothetical protein ECAE60S_04391 [Eoetvoesiella caeni]